MKQQVQELVDVLAGLALFADLTKPQLEAVAHYFDEEWFTEGQRILRKGLSGPNFYVILDGEAAVRIGDETRAILGRGDFFGEVSVLLGEPPTADVVAMRPLRCAVLPGPETEGVLVNNPRVMYRILQAQARRLKVANQWRS
jgi:CRP-like cAMP-binding protein